MPKIVKIVALAPSAAHALEFVPMGAKGIHIHPLSEPVKGHEVDDVASGKCLGFIPGGWAIAIQYEQGQFE